MSGPSFSQRYGYTPASKSVQRESMDQDLRNGLWNAVSLYILDYDLYDSFGDRRQLGESINYYIFLGIYMNFLKLRIKGNNTGTIYIKDFNDYIDDWFQKIEWHKCFDFIEFVVNQDLRNDMKVGFIRVINCNLERENSAYRLVNGQFTEITTASELEEIDAAFTTTSTDRLAVIRTHLDAALRCLSSRTAPDYRNSIKESFSAVEALAQIYTGDSKGTLGNLLKKMALHEAQKRAFTALYGYASDADGIRHALTEDDKEISKADARFYLIVCSAFINFCIETLTLPAG